MTRSALLVALLAAALSACSTRGAAPTATAGAGAPEERIHALLLNGGGRREINFQSHVGHLERLIGLLEANGVAAEDIAIFSADGDDPAADLATREVQGHEDEWMLPASGVARFLAPRIEYVDTRIAGFDVRPARKADLEAWFADEGADLGEGDTLLFYVTDHGEVNADDLSNNTITLWNERLSVAELTGLLGRLDPSVRVVMLMSQCFSGSFSNAIRLAGAEPSGAVCGYFSSTADRLAYGCYPENRGKDGVGHSFEFFEALEPLGAFDAAHRRVLLTDDTPDVPNTTSEFYLTEVLEQRAEETGKSMTEVVDALLAEAWRDRGAYESDIRLLDSIGHTFGSFSPRSLQELDEQARVLPEFSERLATYAARWGEALEALRVETFARFREAEPAWNSRLDPQSLKGLTAEQRAQLLAELTEAYAAYVKADPERLARLESLRTKAEAAEAASYRAEVRLGVVLRMRALLTRVAGEVYMARYATEAQRLAYERLQSCERLQLAAAEGDRAAALAPPKAFPPLVEERELVESVMPAWMGIQYRPVPETPRRRYGVSHGAVVVGSVYPDSPASKAGVRQGDMILGPPARHFTEPHQVREWTMGSEVGRAEPLDLLRDGKALRISLKPGPYPLDLPKLPGPPKVGSPAPPLKLEPYRGQVELSKSKPTMLFFWATWCAVCHSSVPELVAFGASRGVDVVAITDEDPEILQPFFEAQAGPFPENVAIDPFRLAFQGFGVSGTPTFVLIDEDGIVRHYQTGYSLTKGIAVEGWKYEPAPKQAGGR